MPNLTYKKDEHLKHRKLIELVFTKGHSKVFYPICFFWIPLEFPINEHPILFGANVSKKKFKHAVDRNLIKRKMREAYRTQKVIWCEHPELSVADLHQQAIMAIYLGSDICDYKSVKKSIRKGILHILQNASPISG